MASARRGSIPARGRSSVVTDREMNFMRLIIACPLIALLLVPSSFTKEWRGIIPLRSTRADVERLLGPPEPGSRGVYRTGSERITVSYAEGPCDYGWQVPP